MHKVLIRPLEILDASISWEWRNDPEIWKYTGNKPDIFITEEIERSWLQEKLNETKSKRFAITVDDNYVGNIQLTDIAEDKTAEYHIFIGERNYWGKGIAKIATKQILRYAKNIGLKKVYLNVNPENKVAIAAYEKTGFKKIDDTIRMIANIDEVPKSKVSVFMMAYNHEKYIPQAIEGVLMQKVNFDFDIVIGEDCSTDNTRKIILDYQAKFPGKFNLILHEKNVGAFANQNFVLESCTGKYIAMCEGDDYWTDPLKLQKQVDFLEANPEYAFCFHDAIIFHQNTGVQRTRIGSREIDTIVNLRSIIIENNIPTASLAFKNNLNWKNLPNWFFNIAKGDYGLVVLLAEKGLGKYIPDVMSVYRVHDGGVWSGKTGSDYHIRQDITFYNFLFDYFHNVEIRKAIILKRNKAYQNKGMFLLRNGKFLSGLYTVLSHWNFTNDKRLKTPVRKILSAVKTSLKL